MKKLVVFSLIALSIQSCLVKRKYAEYHFNKMYEETYKHDTLEIIEFHDCSQSRIDSHNYEDTIKRVFFKYIS